MSKNDNRYPRVWKSAELQAVAIVYGDRVEYYWTQGSYGRQISRGYDGQKYNPYRAEEVLTNEGFHRVHFVEVTDPICQTIDAIHGTEIDDGLVH